MALHKHGKGEPSLCYCGDVRFDVDPTECAWCGATENLTPSGICQHCDGDCDSDCDRCVEDDTPFDDGDDDPFDDDPHDGHCPICDGGDEE